MLCKIEMVNKQNTIMNHQAIIKGIEVITKEQVNMIKNKNQ